MERSNKDMVTEYVDVMWNQQDLTKGLSYLTPELAGSDVVGHMTQAFDAFSDLQVGVLEPGPIAEGDYVVIRVGISALHDSGEFAGQPPSGKHLRWESIRIFRFENGLIAETWAMQDRLGLMEQMGAVLSTADQVNWAAGGGDSD